MKKLVRFCVAISMLATSLSVFSQRLPENAPYPGGIALVDIPARLTQTGIPKVSYLGQRVMILKTNAGADARWLAIVGIPLSAKPGVQELTLETATGKTSLEFKIQDKAYQEQRLQIANQRQVNPLQEDLERIGRERQEMDRAFVNWNQNITPNFAFELPVDGPVSSPFGLKRFFNDQPRNPHSGLDIAAPEGTPIKAPAESVVLTTGNYFFNGNTVILDHGHGLTSMYCHMSEIKVKPGVQLSTGDVIGLVGQTGRVTGAHLHWSVSLNNARVDPGLLVGE